MILACIVSQDLKKVKRAGKNPIRGRAHKNLTRPSRSCILIRRTRFCNTQLDSHHASRSSYTQLDSHNTTRFAHHHIIELDHHKSQLALRDSSYHHITQLDSHNTQLDSCAKVQECVGMQLDSRIVRESCFTPLTPSHTI